MWNAGDYKLILHNFIIFNCCLSISGDGFLGAERRQILGDDKKLSHLVIISKSSRSLEKRIIIFVMLLFKIFRTCIAGLDMQKWIEYCLMSLENVFPL